MAEDAPKSPAAVTEPVVAESAEAPASSDAPAAESTPAPAAEEPSSSNKAADEEDTKPADEEATAKINGSEEKVEKSADTASTPAKKTPKAARRKSLANLKKTKEAAAAEQKFQPGEFVLAKMRSYPPWPSVILSKELLPEVMVRSTSTNQKGYRSLESIGAAAWETQYPIFFMGTYEYSWISVLDLEPLSKEKIDTGAAGRKTKKLVEAFQEASEGFSLDNVKEILEHGTMEIDDEAVVDPEDEDEMEVDDEEEPASDEDKPKKRQGKKRKKSETASDDEADSEKPAKTPKKAAAKAKTPKSAKSTPAKTPKTPANGSAKKAAKEKTPAKAKKAATPKSTKRGAKSKETVDTEDDNKISDSKQLAKEPEEEQQRVMLMRRHMLQKAFLNKDKTPPKEEDMPQLNTCLKSLEQWTDMPANLIKKTKIHKVLRHIMKVEYEIPLDDKLQFRERSKTLHDQLMNVLNAVPAEEEAKEESKEDKKDETVDEKKDETNEVATDEKPSEDKVDEEKAEESKTEKAKEEVKPVEEEEKKTNGTAEAKESTPVVKEVEMRDAPAEETEKKEEKEKSEAAVAETTEA